MVSQITVEEVRKELESIIPKLVPYYEVNQYGLPSEGRVMLKREGTYIICTKEADQPKFIVTPLVDGKSLPEIFGGTGSNLECGTLVEAVAVSEWATKAPNSKPDLQKLREAVGRYYRF